MLDVGSVVAAAVVVPLAYYGLKLFNMVGLIRIHNNHLLNAVTGHIWLLFSAMLFWICYGMPQFDTAVSPRYASLLGLAPLVLLVGCCLVFREYAPTSRPSIALSDTQIARLGGIIDFIGVVLLAIYIAILVGVVK